MKFSHLHVSVRDLPSAIRWFADVARLKATYENGRMASFSLGGDFGLILDAAAADSTATLAWETADCDADFARFVARGAGVEAAPEDLAWGVRAAYLRGPGGLVIELEQPLAPS